MWYLLVTRTMFPDCVKMQALPVRALSKDVVPIWTIYRGLRQSGQCLHEKSILTVYGSVSTMNLLEVLFPCVSVSPLGVATHTYLLFCQYINVMLEAACTAAFLDSLCCEFTILNVFNEANNLCYEDNPVTDLYVLLHLCKSKTDPFYHSVTAQLHCTGQKFTRFQLFLDIYVSAPKYFTKPEAFFSNWNLAFFSHIHFSFHICVYNQLITMSTLLILVQPLQLILHSLRTISSKYLADGTPTVMPVTYIHFLV